MVLRKDTSAKVESGKGLERGEGGSQVLGMKRVGGKGKSACKDPTEMSPGRFKEEQGGQPGGLQWVSGADGPDEVRERVLDQIKYRSINLQLLLGCGTSLESFEQRCDVT